MPGLRQEQERLKQIRDRQLADRDPTVKKKEFQRQSVQRERQRYRPFTMKGAWGEIPHIWKGMLYGFLLGLVGAFIITGAWISRWAWIASLVLILCLIMIGALIGRAADARDDIRENLR